MRLRISWDQGHMFGVLNDTATARELWDILPCSSMANTWGEEVYFSVPMNAELEADAQQVVPAGTICFWVEGRSLAIPFGPTPVSRGNECRLVTRVNIVGKLEGNAQMLASIRGGDRIRIDAAA